MSESERFRVRRDEGITAMLISRDRDKLFNAINFFVSNTKKCGKVKLFKLLYFLDFEHFKLTGRSVTGMEYYAWKMGPVPVELHDEIEKPKPDMAENFRFEDIIFKNGEQKMLSVNPLKPFNDDHFSKREMKIMRALAAQYINSRAEEMIEATHLENEPWDKVYVKEDRKQALIPYLLSVPQEDQSLMAKISSDRSELRSALR